MDILIILYHILLGKNLHVLEAEVDMDADHVNDHDVEMGFVDDV